MLGVALWTQERRVVRHGGTFSNTELALATHSGAELACMHDSIPMQTAQVLRLGFRADKPGDAICRGAANRRHNF